MHFHTYLGRPGPVTHREHLTWLAWFVEEWNMPDRTDHYLMQTAYSIERGNVKNPRSLKLDQFKLQFGSKSKQRQLTKEQATRISQAGWVGRMSMPVKQRKLSKGDLPNDR